MVKLALLYRSGLKLRIVLEITLKFRLSYLNECSEENEMMLERIRILSWLRT